MTKMTRFFWSASGIALYLYAMTILVQNGYNDYFNIPRNFIESSLVANITFFWTLIPSLWTVIVSQWGVFVIALVIIFILHIESNSFFKRFIEKSIVFIVTGFALYVLYHAYAFGTERAKTTTSFYSFKESCNPTTTKGIRYVGPIIHQNKVILVPINASSTLQTGFRALDLTNTSCDLMIESIGTIKR